MDPEHLKDAAQRRDDAQKLGVPIGVPGSTLQNPEMDELPHDDEEAQRARAPVPLVFDVVGIPIVVVCGLLSVSAPKAVVAVTAAAESAISGVVDHRVELQQPVALFHHRRGVRASRECLRAR